MRFNLLVTPPFSIDLILFISTCHAQITKLPNLSSIDPSVQGFSSGAGMAHQLHVSNSKIFKKAAVLTGPPYYCAIDNFVTATTTCMKGTGNINVKQLVQWANNAAALGYIDDTENLLDSKVFVLSGSLDTVIVPEVATKVSEFYSEVGLDDNMVETVYNIPSEHGWISDSVGGPCDQQNPPDFFQNCGYDLTLNVASWLYSDVNQTQIDKARKIENGSDSKRSTGQLVQWNKQYFNANETAIKCALMIVFFQKLHRKILDFCIF